MPHLHRLRERVFWIASSIVDGCYNSWRRFDLLTGATWLRRGYEIEERVPRFYFLVKPVENSQLRILTTLSLLNCQ